MAIPEALRELLRKWPCSVLLELLRQQLCLRCIFRFLNVRDGLYSVELPSPAELYAAFNDSNGQDHAQEVSSGEDQLESICLICLGTLQRLFSSQEGGKGQPLENNAVSQVLRAIDEGGHSVGETFCLEVTLPALILLRERGFWLYLKTKFHGEALFSGEDVSIVSLKEAVKWSLLERLENAMEAKFDPNATFRVALIFKHSGSPADMKFSAAASTGDGKRKRNGHYDVESQGFAAAVAARAATDGGESLASVQRCLASMNDEQFMKRYEIPPSKVAAPCEITAITWRNAVYVGGRYLKFSRNVSQSRWVIDDERMGEGSVQEFVGDIIVPCFKADSYKFHAAGREDIDVRMLGSGRPFIIELINARQIPSVAELEQAEVAINVQRGSWIKVKGLRHVGVEVCALMRQGEVEKQKEYVAVVWIDRPVTEEDFKRLSELKELEIQQKTPIRDEMRDPPGSDSYFLLHLRTQAGTYIKEFVHGDLGRTYPNVGSLLGCSADILQLDVVDVEMEFE